MLQRVDAARLRSRATPTPVFSYNQGAPAEYNLIGLALAAHRALNGPPLEPAMNWMHRLRLRALALLIGTALGAFALVSWATLPFWPVIGVAVAVVALAMGSMTTKLGSATCWGCGADLGEKPAGVYGVTCDSCGTINERLAALESETLDLDDEDEPSTTV